MRDSQPANKQLVKAVILIAILLFLIVGFFTVRNIILKRQQETTHKVLYSAITDVRSVVRVTSLEGIRSVPVHYEKDGVGAFGVGTYRFRITYDVDQMDSYVHGDSIIVRLPKEKITILEDESQGFKVLDVWGTNIFSRFIGPDLSVDRENRMRATAMAQVDSDLRSQGIVKQARDHAMTLITDMLSLVPGTVIVLGPDDPLPDSLADRDVVPNPELEPSYPKIRK